MGAPRFDADGNRLVTCPGCDGLIIPGQRVVGVPDPDPWRALWHVGCRQAAHAPHPTAAPGEAPDPTPGRVG
jgi:hypothetical protein